MLKVAYPSPWVSIEPGLQHTLIGDLLLSNQFESLTGVSATGVIIPLAAKDWQASEDFKNYRFRIDGSKTFPDGQRLTAADVKRSWEEAFSKEPISANSGVKSLLYKIEGFENFEKSGQLEGLRVIDEDTLEVRLTEPMRTTLESLQSSRFGVFRNRADGGFEGTGRFELSLSEDNRVILTPRQDNAGENGQGPIPSIEARYMSYPESIQALAQGEVDAIPYTLAVSNLANGLYDPQIELVIGQEAAHVGIGLNSNDQSIFAQKKMRQAFQSLFLEALEKASTELPDERLFSKDPQFFLPLQAGRLSQAEAAELIDIGKAYKEDLLAQARQRPLKVVYLPWQEGYVEILRKAGLTIDPGAQASDPKDYLKSAFSQEGPDLIVQNFGMAGSDPDGLYHKFGEHGALRTPYVYSESVGQLLEQGRALVDPEAVNAHYQKVNSAILTEVPMVHIGFARSVLAYRPDRVSLDTQTKFRGHGHLHSFRKK